MQTVQSSAFACVTTQPETRLRVRRQIVSLKRMSTAGKSVRFPKMLKVFSLETQNSL